MKPLAGVRVLDLSRNAPGPFASMLLAGLGAEVIEIGGGRAGEALPVLARGKRRITLNLKKPAGRAALHALVRQADVVLEGYRPGVAATLGAGYEELSRINNRLVYCSLTGYGQVGPMAQVPSHDIDYLALSGLLGALGPVDDVPVPPLNLVADMAGGGLYAAFGIVAALHDRHRSDRGAYVDVAMLDGVMSMMSMWYGEWGLPTFPGRGLGLAGGEAPFYRCYRCADERFVAVGAVEPQFFSALWAGLGLTEAVPDHLDRAAWPGLTERFTGIFATRTRDEWAERLEPLNACVTPVLAPDEVWAHRQVKARHPAAGPDAVPAVPLVGSPEPPPPLELGDVTEDVLRARGFSSDQIAAVLAENDVAGAGGLQWPPIQDSSS